MDGRHRLLPQDDHRHDAPSSTERDDSTIYVSSDSYKFRQSFHRLNEVIKEPRGYTNSQIRYPFVDGIGRSTEAPLKDYYLSPTNGQLRELVVQASDKEFDKFNDTTWARRKCHNVSPWSLRLCSMPDRNKQGGLVFVGKWLLASGGLIFTLVVPIRDPKIRWSGNYAPFPYTYHGYPKTAKNSYEDEPNGTDYNASEYTAAKAEQIHKERVLLQSRVTRLFRPLRLNIEKQAQEQDRSGRSPRFKLQETSVWRRDNFTDTDPEYIFVSYTRDQFQTTHDLLCLHSIAEQATLNAGLKAYWLDNCLDDHDAADVYRINDYIRQCSGVVIIRGHPSSQMQVSFDPHSLNGLLRVWGRRVWTFPEVLLAPQHKPIQVYTKDLMEVEPSGVSIPRKQFAEIVWDDAALSGELVNHFEGSLFLSRLQLATLAFRCLRTRSLQRGDEVHRHQGDRVYALAGLMKERPDADTTDSELQAFARLSLANDSDQLLERLICLQPKFVGQPWQEMQDAWDIPLWDVLPTCQVSAVGHDDTFLIDGARGAAVRWKGFKSVAASRGFSWVRFFAKTFINLTPFVIFLAIIFLIVGGGFQASISADPYRSEDDSSIIKSISDSMYGVGTALLVTACLLVLTYPKLVPKLYGGKTYGQQAWFFGLEGYERIEEIERRLYNTHTGRLKWAPYGSPLSRHRPVSVTGRSKNCETVKQCRGVDPMSSEDVRRQIDDGRRQGMRLFTLVDTGTMSVFLFLARRPPVAFLVCGQEGGMQRAVGVSYDHTMETVHRETVLRMSTPVLNRMSRVARCRISLGRNEDSLKWATEHVKTYQDV